MNFGVTEIIVFLLGQCTVGAAIWGGIRADLRAMHIRLDSLERRFDSHIDNNSTWHGDDRRSR